MKTGAPWKQQVGGWELPRNGLGLFFSHLACEMRFLAQSSAFYPRMVLSQQTKQRIEMKIALALRKARISC